MRLFIGLIYLLHGSNGDVGGDVMLQQHVLRSNALNSTAFNTTENTTQPTIPAHPTIAAPVINNGGDNSDKSIFMLGILVSFCIVAVLGVVLTVVCWVRVFSGPKKTGNTGSKEGAGEFKSKDAENLDQRNMRDVQLTEYEKRKRQMKELDCQQEPIPENGVDESDNECELDEITAVQSQPLEEETIVNPHFMHHYVPVQSAGSR